MTGTQERVSVVRGDRVCTHCRYNLIGQPVLREPHYELLIVRCPECGVVAALQEYPLLGRWASRWALFFTLLWLLALLAFSAGAIGATLGITGSIADEICNGHRNSLREDWTGWIEANYPDEKTQMWFWNPVHFDEWYAARPPAMQLAAAGGWRSVVWEWDLLLFLIPIVAVFLFGCLGAVALIRQSRTRLVVRGILPWLAIGVIFGIFWYTMTREAPGRFNDIAWSQIGFPLMALALAIELVAFLAGLAAGRSVARGVVRALLPARLRTPLSLLWLTDGLTPPGLVTEGAEP